jgi:hypothetical protein
MSAERKLSHISKIYCTQYKTEAELFIQDKHPSGLRHLIVQYDDGRPEFAAAICKDWTERDISDFLLWPLKNPGTKHPVWEIPERLYHSRQLFRWWAGEEPKRASVPTKKGRKRIAGQTEMLLPIAGDKGKELAAKPVSRPSARPKKAG